MILVLYRGSDFNLDKRYRQVLVCHAPALEFKDSIYRPSSELLCHTCPCISQFYLLVLAGTTQKTFENESFHVSASQLFIPFLTFQKPG